MAIKDKLQEQASVTSANDDTSTIRVEDSAEGITATAILTSGPGEAILQYSLDGTNYVDVGSSSTASFGNASLGPVRFIRLAVTSGTWTLQLYQRLDSNDQ